VRIVLDSNVLLAAIGYGGLCRWVMDACIDSHELILSEHILGEVQRHLRSKVGHSPSMAEHHVAVLREAAEIVTPAEVPPGACRDPDDLPVLGTVLAGMADCLVTGDQDLLILGEFGGHPILSPRQFWHRLK
jgi:uncharacterized protein